MRIGAALAGIALLLPSAGHAWGYYAHGITAEIAQANIRPETRAKLDRLFAAEPLIGTPDCPLGNLVEAATWPDCIRREGWRWGYTSAWHYQTEPVTEDYDVRKNCSGGNCVSAQIERNFRILADESLPANVRLQALAFVVHFTGDIHMPLHSGDLDGRQRPRGCLWHRAGAEPALDLGRTAGRARDHQRAAFSGAPLHRRRARGARGRHACRLGPRKLGDRARLRLPQCLRP